MGALAQLARSTGLTTDFAYTVGDRLERTTTTDGVSVLQDDLIEWDLRGQIGAVTDPFGRHDYRYDTHGQLIRADHPAGSGIPDELYVYDALGNRIEWAGNPAVEVVYDAEDRLTQDAEFLYAYDNEGRLLSKEDRSSGHLWSYSWDNFGQLKAIEHPDGSLTTFAYDGLGRRVQVDDKGAVTRFAWDGDALRMVFDGANVLQRWQSTDLYGELLAEYDAVSGLTEDTLRNHLGSVLDAPRDSFGNPVASPTGFAPHALTWHTQDPTGLIYARARYLDPKTGRFLSQDPVLSGNQYVYAVNDPLTMWDPYGLVAATEDSTFRSQISLAAREGAEEIGEELVCQFMTDAAMVALVHPVGQIVWSWGARRLRGGPARGARRVAAGARCSRSRATRSCR